MCFWVLRLATDVAGGMCAQARWRPSGLQRPQARSYSPSPRKPPQNSNPLLADAPDPACDTPPHHEPRAHGASAAAETPGRGVSAPPRPSTSRGRHMQQSLHMHEMQAPAGRGLDEYDDHAFVSTPDERVPGHVRAGVQVPTQPSQYPGSAGDEIFGILAEEVRSACSLPCCALQMCRTCCDCRRVQERSSHRVLLMGIV